MLRFLAPALAALCLMAPAAQAAAPPAVVFSGQVSLASDGMVRGLSETTGNPQGVVNLSLVHGPLYGGVLIKNVATPEGADSQNNVYIGMRAPVGGFKLNAQVFFKDNVGTVPGTQHRFVEYQFDASRTFGDTTVKLMVLHSPDFYARTRASTWTEASLSQKLSPKWTVSGAYGHRSVTPAKNYNGWNLGAAYALWPRTTVDFRYFDTDEHRFGKNYVSRFRMMLTQAF